MSDDAHAILNETVAYQEAPAEDAAAEETAATETETEESSSNVDFARKFAALSKRDRELRTRESQWEADRAGIEAELARYKEAEEAAKQPEKLAWNIRGKKNPLKFMEEEFGYGWDKLTEMALNDGELPADVQMQLKFDELDKKYSDQLEQLQNQLQEKETKEEESKLDTAVANFKSEIDSHVSSNADDYPLVEAFEAKDLIFETIETHYAETSAAGEPKVLSIEEATKSVEEYLAEKFSKVAPKFREPVEPESPDSQSPTLSNAHSATASISSERKLTEEESKARAAQLIKWD